MANASFADSIQRPKPGRNSPTSWSGAASIRPKPAKACGCRASTSFRYPKRCARISRPRRLFEVPVETAISMYNFRAEDVVANIAPRPLLLFHTANDVITPTEQSIRLFEKAGSPAELMFVNGTSHFPLSEKDAPRTRVLIRSWLDQFFPTPLQGTGLSGAAERSRCSRRRSATLCSGAPWLRAGFRKRRRSRWPRCWSGRTRAVWTPTASCASPAMSR